MNVSFKIVILNKLDHLKVENSLKFDKASSVKIKIYSIKQAETLLIIKVLINQKIFLLRNVSDSIFY